MARLRFPGRPGHRFDRISVKYFADDYRNITDPSLAFLPRFQSGLKEFRELTGTSDEEKEFEGFTKEDVKESERKLKEHLEEETREAKAKASPTSEDEKPELVTRLGRARRSLDSLPASERTRNRIKTLVRKSYSEVLKTGLVSPGKTHAVVQLRELPASVTSQRSRPKKFKLDVKNDVPVAETIIEKPVLKVKQTEKDRAKFLLDKARQANLLLQQKAMKRKLSPGVKYPKKQFVLPTQSSRSSRVIKPNKRFLEDESFDTDVKRKSNRGICPSDSFTTQEEVVNTSASSVHETTPSKPSVFSNKYFSDKSPGLFEQPLICDGKRDRKPSLKLRLGSEKDGFDPHCKFDLPFHTGKSPPALTSPLAAPKLGTSLFTSPGSQAQFQKASENQRLGMLGLGSARKQGASIVQKAKLQLNRAALNKSKAALARSLKAEMKREAKIIAKQLVMQDLTSPEKGIVVSPVSEEPKKKRRRKCCVVCSQKTELLPYNNALVCSPCKIFYLKNKSRAKHATLPPWKCAQLKGEIGRCKITAETKSKCRYCRLKSCIDAGFPQASTLQYLLEGVRKKDGSESAVEEVRTPVKAALAAKLSPALKSPPGTAQQPVTTPKAVKILQTPEVRIITDHSSSQFGSEEELSPLKGQEGSEKKQRKRRAFKELLRTKQEKPESGASPEAPASTPAPPPPSMVSPVQGSVEESPSPGAPGPRIKHVCRNAAVVLGKPIARFPESSGLRLSALPTQDKVQLWKKEEATRAATVESDDDRPMEEIIQKSPESVVIMKKSPGMKAKPLKKLSGVGGLRLYKKKTRCKKCTACLAKECGKCRNCLDKPKFGGRGVSKQACIKRRCSNPQFRRSATAAFIKPKGSGTDSNTESIQSSPEKSARTSTSAVQVALDLDQDEEESQGPGEENSSITVPGAEHSTVTVKGLESQAGTLVEDQAAAGSGSRVAADKGEVIGTSRQARGRVGARGGRSEVRSLDFDLDSFPEVRLERVGMGRRPGKISSRLMKKLDTQQRFNKNHGNNDAQCFPVSLQHVIPASRQWGGILSQPRFHPIKVDFKPSCDINSVWTYGLALTMSAAMSVRTLCFLCGSAGKHEMIYCNLCCEPFHEFCLEEFERPTREHYNDWVCSKCQYCHVCGRQNHLLQCDRCQNTYHPGCLGPNYPTKPSKKKNIWICTKCVKCKSCGATTPGSSSDATWTYDFSLCYECGKLMDKGNFCPICHKCYSDDDWESKMIQCNMCESWVHSRCEGLTDEMYEILSYLPEDLCFFCRNCHPHGCPEWERTLKRELQQGLENILHTLILTKSAQYILRHDQKKSPPKPSSQQKEIEPPPETCPQITDIEQTKTDLVEQDKPSVDTNSDSSDQKVSDTPVNDCVKSESNIACDNVPKESDITCKSDPDDVTKSTEQTDHEDNSEKQLTSSGETDKVAEHGEETGNRCPDISSKTEDVDSGCVHESAKPDCDTDGKDSAVPMDVSDNDTAKENVCDKSVKVCDSDSEKSATCSVSCDTNENCSKMDTVNSDQGKLADDKEMDVDKVIRVSVPSGRLLCGDIVIVNPTDMSESHTSIKLHDSKELVPAETSEVPVTLDTEMSTKKETKSVTVSNPSKKSLSVHFKLDGAVRSETTPEKTPEITYPQDLMAMAEEMKTGRYKSVAVFCEDILRIIQSFLDDDTETRISRKKAISSARSCFVKQMEKIFPWFKVKDCRFWFSNKNMPYGMLPDATLPPSGDHTYAQWLERTALPLSPQPSPFKRRVATPVKKIMPFDDDEGEGPLLEGEDMRRCLFCLQYGDQDPDDAGRLLYCGQDDWCHINCALWSAEVYEDADGSLQNLVEAYSRGKMLKCNLCQVRGATVGCNTKGCTANYHFMCARRSRCRLQEDKKVFCREHASHVDGDVMGKNSFRVLRRALVQTQRVRTVKKFWAKGLATENIRILFGSCCVESLGRLTDLSDKRKFLQPVDFMSTRIYWSTKDARRRCVYTCRVIEVRPEQMKSPSIGIKDMRIVHDEAHPDYVPLSSLELYGIDLTITGAAECGKRPANIIDLTEASHDSSGTVSATEDCQIVSPEAARLDQSLNSKLAVEGSQEGGVRQSLQKKRSVRRASFSGNLSQKEEESQSKSLSSSWPRPSEKKKSISSKPDLSLLSPQTLRMLGIKDPSKYCKPSGVTDENKEDDDCQLLKIANRLNKAAAKCSKTDTKQRALRGSSVERESPARLSRSPSPVVRQARSQSVETVDSLKLSTVNRAESPFRPLLSNKLADLPERPFSPPVRMLSRARSLSVDKEICLSNSCSTRIQCTSAISNTQNISGYLDGKPMVSVLKKPVSISNSLLSPEPTPVDCSSPVSRSLEQDRVSDLPKICESESEWAEDKDAATPKTEVSGEPTEAAIPESEVSGDPAERGTEALTPDCEVNSEPAETGTDSVTHEGEPSGLPLGSLSGVSESGEVDTAVDTDTDACSQITSQEGTEDLPDPDNESSGISVCITDETGETQETIVVVTESGESLSEEDAIKIVQEVIESRSSSESTTQTSETLEDEVNNLEIDKGDAKADMDSSNGVEKCDNLDMESGSAIDNDCLLLAYEAEERSDSPFVPNIDGDNIENDRNTELKRNVTLNRSVKTKEDDKNENKGENEIVLQGDRRDFAEEDYKNEPEGEDETELEENLRYLAEEDDKNENEGENETELQEDLSDLAELCPLADTSNIDEELNENINENPEAERESDIKARDIVIDLTDTDDREPEAIQVDSGDDNSESNGQTDTNEIDQIIEDDSDLELLYEIDNSIESESEQDRDVAEQVSDVKKSKVCEVDPNENENSSSSVQEITEPDDSELKAIAERDSQTTNRIDSDEIDGDDCKQVLNPSEMKAELTQMFSDSGLNGGSVERELLLKCISVIEEEEDGNTVSVKYLGIDVDRKSPEIFDKNIIMSPQESELFKHTEIKKGETENENDLSEDTSNKGDRDSSDDGEAGDLDADDDNLQPDDDVLENEKEIVDDERDTSPILEDERDNSEKHEVLRGLGLGTCDEVEKIKNSPPKIPSPIKIYEPKLEQRLERKRRYLQKSPLKIYPLRKSIVFPVRRDDTESFLDRAGNSEKIRMLTGGSADNPGTVSMLPVLDPISKKIKEESIAKSCPGEKGPFKCPMCRRMYRTETSYKTHVEKCTFCVSSSEEDENDVCDGEESSLISKTRKQVKLMRYKRRLLKLQKNGQLDNREKKSREGSEVDEKQTDDKPARSSLRRSTITQRVAIEVEEKRLKQEALKESTQKHRGRPPLNTSLDSQKDNKNKTPTANNSCENSQEKRGRGRPRKNSLTSPEPSETRLSDREMRRKSRELRVKETEKDSSDSDDDTQDEEVDTAVKRGRGRPKKNVSSDTDLALESNSVNSVELGKRKMEGASDDPHAAKDGKKHCSGLESIEIGSDQSACESDFTSPNSQKKKGRGRPRKLDKGLHSQNSNSDEIDEIENDTKNESPEEEDIGDHSDVESRTDKTDTNTDTESKSETKVDEEPMMNGLDDSEPEESMELDELCPATRSSSESSADEILDPLTGLLIDKATGALLPFPNTGTPKSLAREKEKQCDSDAPNAGVSKDIQSSDVQEDLNQKEKGRNHSGKSESGELKGKDSHYDSSVMKEKETGNHGHGFKGNSNMPNLGNLGHSQIDSHHMPHSSNAQLVSSVTPHLTKPSDPGPGDGSIQHISKRPRIDLGNNSSLQHNTNRDNNLHERAKKESPSIPGINNLGAGLSSQDIPKAVLQLLKEGHKVVIKNPKLNKSFLWQKTDNGYIGRSLDSKEFETMKSPKSGANEHIPSVHDAVRKKEVEGGIAAALDKIQANNTTASNTDTSREIFQTASQILAARKKQEEAQNSAMAAPVQPPAIIAAAERLPSSIPASGVTNTAAGRAIAPAGVAPLRAEYMGGVVIAKRKDRTIAQVKERIHKSANVATNVLRNIALSNNASSLQGLTIKPREILPVSSPPGIQPAAPSPGVLSVASSIPGLVRNIQPILSAQGQTFVTDHTAAMPQPVLQLVNKPPMLLQPSVQQCPPRSSFPQFAQTGLHTLTAAQAVLGLAVPSLPTQGTILPQPITSLSPLQTSIFPQPVASSGPSPIFQHQVISPPQAATLIQQSQALSKPCLTSLLQQQISSSPSDQPTVLKQPVISPVSAQTRLIQQQLGSLLQQRLASSVATAVTSCLVPQLVQATAVTAGTGLIGCPQVLTPAIQSLNSSIRQQTRQALQTHIKPSSAPAFTGQPEPRTIAPRPKPPASANQFTSLVKQSAPPNQTASFFKPSATPNQTTLFYKPSATANQTASFLKPSPPANQTASFHKPSAPAIQTASSSLSTTSQSNVPSQLLNQVPAPRSARYEKMKKFLLQRSQMPLSKPMKPLGMTKKAPLLVTLDREANGMVKGQYGNLCHKPGYQVASEKDGRRRQKWKRRKSHELALKATIKNMALPHSVDKASHPIIHLQKESACLPTPAVELEVKDVPLSEVADADPAGAAATGGHNLGHLEYEIISDDGFTARADSLDGAWKQVTEKVQDARAASRLKQLSYAGLPSLQMLGLSQPSVMYHIEQLYGANYCRKYKFQYHKHELAEQELELVNPSGCIRTEPYSGRHPFDMFSFLLSRYRQLPPRCDSTHDVEMVQKSSRRATSMDLPMAMRFRKLKEHSKEAVGVYRSYIHGRGLFCKRKIDAGEMIIEYSGELIRNSMTDKREKYYESKGIGCYMFRIDDVDVVDATMKGSAARFINHSCEPNCYSKVITVDNRKHIVIFAMRAISRGEELTYDYKFPIEEVKIPCTCGSKKCRKYLN